jgi:hypothetical protein
MLPNVHLHVVDILDLDRIDQHVDNLDLTWVPFEVDQFLHNQEVQLRNQEVHFLFCLLYLLNLTEHLVKKQCSQDFVLLDVKLQMNHGGSQYIVLLVKLQMNHGGSQKFIVHPTSNSKMYQTNVTLVTLCNNAQY